MEKKRISVFVAGQRFTILSDEDENYVVEIAAKIDARITSLTISQNMSRERAAVLTALDFADDNEQDKREIAAIKEQIKDYVTEISKLSEMNTAINAENNQLKREIAAMKETQLLNNTALKDAQRSRTADEKEKESLKAQIRALQEKVESLSAVSVPEPAPVEDLPAPPEKEVTAEDDLYFGTREEPPVPAVRKEKKSRHEHNHVNPYKQQYMQKKNDQKGYTQQRQYSLFDKDE